MKKLILCFDGTWNEPKGQPTNVVKLAQAILPKDDRLQEQIIYYDTGVGTDGGWFDRVIGGVTGAGLEKNIIDGYRWLCQNYHAGDQIFITGFSRGAFTARSLAGLIGAAGILPRHSLSELMAAWEFYQTKPADRAASSFKPYVVPEIAVGVWDTVGALGLPVGGGMEEKHQFHDTGLGDHILMAFHALAIDEVRRPFRPTIWTGNDAQLKQDKSRRCQQCWFIGSHSDVGGGVESSGLSDISLKWMINSFRVNSSLAFDQGFIENGMNPDPLTPITDSAKGYILSRLNPAVREFSQPNMLGGQIHESVADRSRVHPAYQPELQKHLGMI